MHGVLCQYAAICLVTCYWPVALIGPASVPRLSTGTVYPSLRTDDSLMIC